MILNEREHSGTMTKFGPQNISHLVLGWGGVPGLACNTVLHHLMPSFCPSAR